MEKVIQYNGATVTVKRGNVRSRLRSTMLYQKFNITEDIDELEWLEINMFVRFLTQTTIEGNIGFNVPAASSNAKVLQAGLDHFLDADNDFYDLVIAALNEVDAPANDAPLLPDADPND